MRLLVGHEVPGICPRLTMVSVINRRPFNKYF
nr:MAG TPA: hypothetical protein [Caudoviricetes sp.]